MSEYLANRDGGKTDEHGFMRAISNVMGGDVISGLLVKQSVSPAMSVVVSVGDIAISSGLGFRYCGWVDADKTLTITTANATNPRKDLVVAFIDKAIVQSTTSNNINALKLVVVAGVAAGSPTEPSGATIQTAVGAGNPYCILALVDVPALDTQITNSQITDRRDMVPGLDDIRAFMRDLGDFVDSGMTVASVSGLNVSMSSGVAFISGNRVDVAAVNPITLVASRDNYIDIGVDGRVYQSDVALGATAPALATGRIRIARVVTGAGSVTLIGQAGGDTDGWEIYPTSPTFNDGWRQYNSGNTHVGNSFNVMRTANNGAAITLGNGTLEVFYKKIGRLVHVRGRFVFGSTTSFAGTSSICVVMPFIPAMNVAQHQSLASSIYMEDAGVKGYFGQLRFQTTGANNGEALLSPFVVVGGTDVTTGGVSATAPFTWGAGDYVTFSGTYEAKR